MTWGSVVLILSAALVIKSDGLSVPNRLAIIELRSRLGSIGRATSRRTPRASTTARFVISSVSLANQTRKRYDGIVEEDPFSTKDNKGNDSLNGFGNMSTPLKKDKNGFSKENIVEGVADSNNNREMDQWKMIMAKDNDVYRSSGDIAVEEEMESLYKDLKDISSDDEEQIEQYWVRIMPSVSYVGTEGIANIKNALRVAYCAHRHQTRKSGEPFIIHPVEVCLLLSRLGMDAETLIAALLHDTVEDTDLTFAQVEALFGKVVRSIVEGETKVSKLPKLAFNDYADEQAENLRQMFVAMTDDYRIIIVKLADRLHNMRTLRFMKPTKQQKISRETLDIFAPLAHRMGIWQFKSELEDTAFMYLYPKEYKKLNKKLRRHQTQFREVLDLSQDLLKKTLERDPTLKGQAASVEVHGHTKELYSLWHKMQTNDLSSLNEIADVVALRVILEPKQNDDNDETDHPNSETDRGVRLCYHVLGLVQHLPGFQPLPRVKDYISFPKPNGYQSLHTALMMNGQTIEVQIRTASMHQVAECGMASRWVHHNRGKSGENGENSDELYNTPWLSSIKEWQDEVVCSRDFVDSVRRELLGKRVFVFLRNGKIQNLSKGATVIDAAFQIHTEVGLSMHGALINGRPVSISYELKNGDVVNILSGEGKPTTDWMLYAKSRSTRSKLRSYFRAKQKESFREAGKILLFDFLNLHKDLILKSSFLQTEGDFNIPTSSAEVATFLPGKTQFNDVEDLLVALGKSHDPAFTRSTVSKLFKVPLSLIVDAEAERKVTLSKRVFALVKESRMKAKDAALGATDQDESLKNPSGIVEDVRHESNRASQNSSWSTFAMNEPTGLVGVVGVANLEGLCEECLPIFGDDIVGTRPSNISHAITTVHRRDCVHAQRALDFASHNTNVNGDSYERINGDASLKYDDESQRNGNGKANGSTDESDVKKGMSRNGKRRQVSTDIPVLLQWPESKVDGLEDIEYFAEIVVVATDRKLLLADCSEVVSEMSEIVKTGSSSSNEYATLEYLIKVSDLDQLQKVMKQLQDISSVVSVKRRFGSKLLKN